jgi:hypothetical protein
MSDLIDRQAVPILELKHLRDEMDIINNSLVEFLNKRGKHE